MAQGQFYFGGISMFKQIISAVLIAIADVLRENEGHKKL